MKTSETHRALGRVLIFGPEVLLGSLLEFEFVVASLTALRVVIVSPFFKVLSGAFWESELFEAVNADKDSRSLFGVWSCGFGGCRISAGKTLGHFLPPERFG